MTLSRSPLAYASARAILEAAMTDPKGIRVEMPSHGKAINFRQQLYSARKVFRRTYTQMGQESCPYDELAVLIDGCSVTVTRNNLIDPGIKITSLSTGKELSIDPDLGVHEPAESPSDFLLEGDGAIFEDSKD